MCPNSMQLAATLKSARKVAVARVLAYRLPWAVQMATYLGFLYVKCAYMWERLLIGSMHDMEVRVIQSGRGNCLC